VKKPKATWVEPKIDAEIEYGALTDDGLLREAVFKGIRDDLAVAKVKAPRLVPSSAARPLIGVPRENILQLLPDAVAPTKDELAAYWTRVWKKALPHLGHRPLKLVRQVHGTTFYHKGPLPKDIPKAVHQLRIEKREGGEGTRLWVDDLEGLPGWSTSVPSNCIPGTRRSNSSSGRTRSWSTSIPKAWNGRRLWRRPCACGTS
jgi:bifunctional non-homologous end joining protein LigD